MIALGVNIDHVATLRQARYRDQKSSFPAPEPDPIEAARIAEKAGAEGITAHLREDRRHVIDRDIRHLGRVVHGKFNLEMSAAEDVVRRALLVRPDQATLVPERRAEVTTEGGLSLKSGRNKEKLARVIKRLSARHIAVSLFIDPDSAAVRAAAALEADAVEIHTGSYANARGRAARRELSRIRHAAEEAAGLGLAVYAGHGLNYVNIAGILAIPEIAEVNIGHSIVSHAMFVGFAQAVREMKALLAWAPKRQNQAKRT